MARNKDSLRLPVVKLKRLMISVGIILVFVCTASLVIHLGRSPVKELSDAEKFKAGLINGLGRLQYELDMGQELDKLVVYNKPKSVKKIFIVTTWRSGSSFLGELITSVPGVFYSFEPLHFLEYYKPRPIWIKPKELLQSVFDCQFTQAYLKHMNKRVKGGGPAYIEYNPRIWDACQVDNKTLCMKPDFVRHLCAHFPIQLVKEVRLTLNEIEAMDLMNQDPTSEWKVIYLVRDPRAVMASRLPLKWCTKDRRNCGSVNRLCNGTLSDLPLIERLRTEEPDRYYLLRYEDFVMDVESETEKLFHFLGLPISSFVRDFLNTHTSVNVAGAHSTYRQLNSTVSTWRKKLSPANITAITSTCAPVLKALNYTL